MCSGSQTRMQVSGFTHAHSSLTPSPSRSKRTVRAGSRSSSSGQARTTEKTTGVTEKPFRGNVAMSFSTCLIRRCSAAVGPRSLTRRRYASPAS